jgi:hypothetical protein
MHNRTRQKLIELRQLGALNCINDIVTVERMPTATEIAEDDNTTAFTSAAAGIWFADNVETLRSFWQEYMDKRDTHFDDVSKCGVTESLCSISDDLYGSFV